MAYNDYEVITYKILKYLYDCLKEDDDIERIRLTREYYDVPRKYWEFSFTPHGFQRVINPALFS